MAPEYATEGLFLVKSDVFSFGILLLEILSGKKNRGAWELWRDGRHSELIDACLGDSCNFSESLRCLHVSLLCVQQHPEERPSMLSVVTMLSNDNSLPEPKEPGFYAGKSSPWAYSSSANQQSSSTNYISVTQLDAR
ncbi:cysteine-rich receptor-like protein kinase 44 [Alnus glutinosa]|uniref:cysteine-rich receptor-like protein kinase 44 n=1 Tax=Alnus glutinosa TaxID=3517 RepID=UPI002D779D1C|nr:cysteine-rich receptor-like protein kinase 44 [Alnus glutinosa]